MLRIYTGYNWAQDSAGDFYISGAVPVLDIWSSATVTMASDQTLDVNGNMTQKLINDYIPTANWPPSHPLRQYNYSYINSSTYTSQNIFNLASTATVTGWINGVSQPTYTLASNTYDGTTPTIQSGQREHDDANYGTGMNVRGNLTSSTCAALVRAVSRLVSTPGPVTNTLARKERRQEWRRGTHECARHNISESQSRGAPSSTTDESTCALPGGLLSDRLEHPALKEVVLNQVLVSFGEDECSLPPANYLVLS